MVYRGIIKDINDLDPEFDILETNITVCENAEIDGTPITTVHAVDPDVSNNTIRQFQLL